MLDFAKLISWLSGTGSSPVPEPANAADRRRFQRLNLDNSRVFIENSGPFAILNLSYGGIRLDLKGYEKLAGIETGQRLLCDIFLENVLISNRVVVRNIAGSLIGCAFSDLSVTESRILKDFIKPRMIGHSLREIESAKIRNDTPELRLRWFQGENNTQVFLWQSLDGENVMQEFYFLDYFISWEKDEPGIKTGMIKESERNRFGRLTPESIAFFKVPSYRALKLGQTILAFSRLPSEAKERLVEEIASEEKRLYHRYVIRENEVYFCPETETHLQIPVINLSLSGIAMLNHIEFKARKSVPVAGRLQLEQKAIKATFTPVYIESQFCGGSLETDEEDRESFSEFLAPRLLAQYLEKVPVPVETPFFAAPGSTNTLYAGLHNTHILTLISPEGKLLAGRIAFMDIFIRFFQKTLFEHRCSEGIIFPGDWEIPAMLLKSEAVISSASAHFCSELLSHSSLPAEIKNAWLEVLKQVV